MSCIARDTNRPKPPSFDYINLQYWNVFSELLFKLWFAYVGHLPLFLTSICPPTMPFDPATLNVYSGEGALASVSPASAAPLLEVTQSTCLVLRS